MASKSKAEAQMDVMSNRIFFSVVAGVLTLFMACSGITQTGGRAGLNPDSRAHKKIISVFRTCNERLETFWLLGEKGISPTYTVVVVGATSPAVPAPSWEELSRQEFYGVFILSRTPDELTMVVDTFPTRAFGDYEVTLVEATEAHVTIAAGRWIAGGSRLGVRTRYFCDLDARKVLRATEHRGVRVSSIFEFGGKVLCIGSDRNLSVIARFDTRLDFRDPGSWRVVDRIGGKEIPAIDSLATMGEALALKSDNAVLFLSPDDWIRAEDRDSLLGQLDFLVTLSVGGLGPWFPVDGMQDKMASDRELRGLADSFEVSRQGVYDLARDTMYEFPRHNFEQLQKYRPRFVGHPNLERIYTICDMIGPYQLVGKRIWFGTTFPDAEGGTGVGAIGFFDLDRKSYQMRYPKDLVDWSTSSIWVGERYAWIGLEDRSEYNRFPGGLLRYDLDSGETKKYDMDAMVHKIFGFGDDVFVGTSDGVYIIGGDETTYLGFDFDVEGRYHLFLRKL
jgi:hypothetical protein